MLLLQETKSRVNCAKQLDDRDASWQVSLSLTLLLQETKSKVENSEKTLKDSKKDIQSVWQQLRQIYFALQVL